MKAAGNDPKSGGTLFRKKTTKKDTQASAAAAQVATAAAVAAQVQSTQLSFDELVALSEREQHDLLQRLIDTDPENRTCFDCLSTPVAACSGRPAGARQCLQCDVPPTSRPTLSASFPSLPVAAVCADAASPHPQ